METERKLTMVLKVEAETKVTSDKGFSQKKNNQNDIKKGDKRMIEWKLAFTQYK